jgi:hypothetical protein
MATIEETLRLWEASLPKTLSLAALFSRSPSTYKWKAPFRALVLRESVFWRTLDLLKQAQSLFVAGHILGSRILVRAAIETIAVLVHLNRLLEKVVNGELSFEDFTLKTSKLLLGSRDKTTKYVSTNIVTILTDADRAYPGLLKAYEELSESTHPNYEGISVGYSFVVHEEFETHFENRWHSIWGSAHERLMRIALDTFEHEYNTVFLKNHELLEAWVANNPSLQEPSVQA